MKKYYVIVSTGDTGLTMVGPFDAELDAVEWLKTSPYAGFYIPIDNDDVGFDEIDGCYTIVLQAP
jgi:hypothetical protein